MNFADIALGWIAADALGATNCVTAQLAVQFVAAPKIGEFVSCSAELVRHTSQIIFVRGLITADGRTVASADGIWKVVEPKPDRKSVVSGKSVSVRVDLGGRRSIQKKKIKKKKDTDTT